MESTLGWRFDFWLVVILAGIVTIIAFFTMPETVSETVPKKFACLIPSSMLRCYSKDAQGLYRMKQTVKDVSFQSMIVIARFLCQQLLLLVYVVLLVGRPACDQSNH